MVSLSWSLILQRLTDRPVHVLDDGDTAGVLLLDYFKSRHGNQVLRELDDVHLVGQQGILAGAVALEKDLFDQFFAQHGVLIGVGSSVAKMKAGS